MVIGGNNPETGSNGLGCLLLINLANSGAKNSLEPEVSNFMVIGKWNFQEFLGIWEPQTEIDYS